jgi:hypothetical protein
MTLAVEGGKWTASRPCRLTRKETILRNIWLGGSVSRRTGVGAAVTKRKIFVSAQNWTGSPSPYHNGHTGSYPGHCWSIYGPWNEKLTMEGGPDSFQIHFTGLDKWLCFLLCRSEVFALAEHIWTQHRPTEIVSLFSGSTRSQAHVSVWFLDQEYQIS